MRIHHANQATDQGVNQDANQGRNLARHQSSGVEFIFNGLAVHAPAGESVAAALFAVGIKTLRSSPRQQTARGMFCLMGSCQECLVTVNGRRVLACRTPVEAGLIVEQVDVADRDANQDGDRDRAAKGEEKGMAMHAPIAQGVSEL